MPHTLSVRQTSVWFQALFGEPIFELLAEFPLLSRRLFGPFASYGGRLDDFSINALTTRLGEASLECRLPLTTVRVYLDRVEATSRALGQEFDAVVVDTIGAIIAHYPSVTPKTYSFTLDLHGVPEGLQAAEFVGRFAAQTPELGPPHGSGTIFYYGPDSPRIASSLTVDLSQPVGNGLFVRMFASYDAQRIELADVWKAVEDYHRAALAGLDLVLGGT